MSDEAGPEKDAASNSGGPRKCRVLLMASSMHGGGSERQVAMLARHLPRERFDIQLCLTHATGELLSEIPPDVRIHSLASSRLDAGGQAILHRLTDRVPGVLLRRQAARFAQLCDRERIDVVYDRTFHSTLIAGHPSLRLSAKRISTIVSPPDQALPRVEKKFVAIKRRRLSQAYRKSHRIIAVSDAVADSAAQYYGLNRDAITVLPNPIDAAWVRSLAGESKRRPSDADTALTLVCVGRMTSEKGQADLISAMEIARKRWPSGAPDLKLRLIGDGPDREALETMARTIIGTGNSAGHRIEFVGTVSPAIPEIASADALILPSHFEGMPNVVLEAFVLGVPVIATRAGGTVQLQSGEDQPTCFWADVRDPESLAAAIVRGVCDPAERTVRADRAKQWVTRNHDLPTFLVEMSQILAE